MDPPVGQPATDERYAALSMPVSPTGFGVPVNSDEPRVGVGRRMSAVAGVVIVQS